MKSKTLACLFCLLNVLFTNAQITINPSFFGQNLWLTNYDDAPFGTIAPFSTEWTPINESGVKMMRVGGRAYDHPEPGDPLTAPNTNLHVKPAGYVTIVDDIRSHGMEPMITIPFIDDLKMSLNAQADTAAEIVRVLNVVHKRNVKYFIIANEPGYDQGYYDPGNTGTVDTIDIQRIRDYILKFAVEMKKIDTSIMIIGPELEWENNAILPKLMSTNSYYSVTGAIPSIFQGEDLSVYPGLVGKYFIDKLSFHCYSGGEPGFPTSWREKYVTGAYYWKDKFQEVYNTYINNTAREGNLNLMVDEFNAIACTTSVLTPWSVQLDTLVDANSFLAGQLVIDLMAGMMAANDGGNPVYEFSNMWSVKESGRSLGYLHSSSNYKKPTYWHYYMMANYFKGKFYEDKNMASHTLHDINRCYRAYACKNSDYIAVIVINQAVNSDTCNAVANGVNSKTFTINFNNSTADFKFDMSMTGWSNYTFTIANESTSLLLFNVAAGSATLLTKQDLKESDFVSAIPNYDFTDPLYKDPASAVSLASPTFYGSISPTYTNTPCAGASTASFSVTAGASSYNWYKMPDLSTSIATTNTVTALGAGMYQVKITNGAEEKWYTKVVHEQSPILMRDSAAIVQYCNSADISLSVSATSGSTILWSPGSYTLATTPTFTVSSPTTYSCTVTKNSCSVTDTMVVMPTDANTANEDLYVRDDSDDVGYEPNNTLGGPEFWTAPQIWVTDSSFAETGTSGPEYATPDLEYRKNGKPFFAHARIHNHGSNTASGLVHLYWAKAGTGMAWPADWENSYDTISATDSVSFADKIGVRVPVSVDPGDSVDIEIPWMLPDPERFNTPFFASNYEHFCLLARIETGCGMTNTEIPNQWENNYHNNNIAQKNIAIHNHNTDYMQHPGDGGIAGLFFHNVKDDEVATTFIFEAKENSSNDFFTDYGNAYLHCSSDFHARWVSGGSISYNMTDLNDTLFEITGDSATISNIALDANERFTVGMRFTCTRQAPSSPNFEYDVIQYDEDSKYIVGGERYVIIPGECPVADVEDDVLNIREGCSDKLEPHDPDEAVTYTWYDENGNLLEGGSEVFISPGASTYFVLHAAQNGCVMTDTTIVNVLMGHGCSKLYMEEQANIDFSIAPNPVKDQFSVSYSLEENETAVLYITNSLGQLMTSKKINPKERKTIIDANDLANGVYYVTLHTENKKSKTLRMVVLK